MPAPKNKLKAALKSDHMQIGLWLGLRDMNVAEIAASAGFDWCMIDAEHGAFDLPAMLAQVQVMGGHQAVVAVRVPADQVWIIKQVLDLGVQTVLVPMIDSAAAAARMVQAVRYPPDGIRGMAAAVVRASDYNAIPDYAASANQQICLMVQAESRAALANIDEISATEGVDCIFIGPADLSIDMGYGGQMDVPEVMEAIEFMITRIRAAGKAVGILAFDPAQMRHFAQLGVTFLGVGSDVFRLAESLRGLAREARDATSL